MENCQVIFEQWQKQLKPDFSGMVIVSFLDRESMTDLSMRTLGKAEATDVLSFRYDGVSNPRVDQAAGEIVICPAVAQDFVQLHKLDLATEYTTLFTHGLLHVAGLDHASTSERAAFEGLTRDIMKSIKQEPISLWLA